MKNHFPMLLSVSALLLCVLEAAAQTSTSNVTAVSTSSTAAAAKLPYGVGDVLSLSRAQINEDVILNYIHSSGTIYNLGPADLVYLRNEGVSDRVLNAMLDQRTLVLAETSARNEAPAVSTTPAAPVYSSVTPAPTTPVYAPVYLEPQPEPSGSSVYILPYAPVHNAYYGYYGSRYTYYSTGFYPSTPVLSFGFRVVGPGHHYRGGFHH